MLPFIQIMLIFYVLMFLVVVFISCMDFILRKIIHGW